jgi:penicillin-binding protein 2
VTELKNTASQLHTFRERTWVIGWVVVVALCLLGLRAFVLQIYRHDQLMQQAESNRTSLLPVAPQRGRILDRNGVVLAENQSVFTLEITPSRTVNLQQTLKDIAELIEITPRDESRFMRLVRESRRFESLPLRTRLSGTEMSVVAAQLYRLPGVEIQARRLRQYPLGETASHVIGHVGRISPREREMMVNWPDEKRNNYLGSDQIGKLGVELGYEDFLHGTTGFERVETAASGRAVRSLETLPPKPGDTVRLSIDARLQYLVEKLYGTRRGALVAIDPRNGEILAFVSKPTFNPNLFVEGIDSENWRLLNESIEKPLLNRALRGLYPPGSTYKPFMALAGLEKGLRSPSTAVHDPGFWVFGNHRFRSVGEKNLGMVDLHRSIVVSSNVYYYTLANEMGIEAIHDFMKPLGFGQLTGIDMPGEVRGILPSPDWKRAAFSRTDQQRWFAGETISVGIGQGYNSFTMLQLANAMAVVANGGTLHKPHVGLSTRAIGVETEEFIHKAPGTDLGYKPAHVRAILDAMEAVTTEGTSARVFAGAPYRSGGKTGTAQAVSIGQREKYDASKLEEHQRDHSLYVAFAPVDNPSIAVAVIVENSGFGSAHAAPLARRVFDYWLLGLYPSEEDIEATQQGQSAAPIGKQRKADEVPWPGNALRE